MKGKEQLLDFIAYLFVILLIVFCLVFFTIPGNFERFQGILKAMTPILIFGSILLVKLKMTSSELREARDSANDQITLIMTFWDKAKYELLLLSLPLILIALSFLNGGPGFVSTLQALIVFAVNLLFLRSIFSKKP